MRVLYVTGDMPYPLTGGARTRNFNILKELSSRHEVTLLSFREPRDSVSASPLDEYCTHIATVPREVAHGGLGRTYGIISALLKRRPYHAGAYHSRRMGENLSQLSASDNFDIVHVDGLYMGQYDEYLPVATPRVLGEHNAEFVIFRRRYQNENNWLKKVYLYLEWRKIRDYERRECPKFDACLTVSETDREHLRSICGDLTFAVIPNGVDIEHFAPSSPVDGARLLYVGSMGWYPNEDAVCYFCESILPLIRREIPEVELTIVGSDPTQKVRQLARNDHIEVTGFVEDPRSYLARATTFITPLRIGSGTRLKILEAMAMGLPVVSTSIGCEGLDLAPERDIIVADGPQEFARRTVGLLRDKPRRVALSQNGRRAVEDKYSWRQIVARLETIYQETVDRKRHSQS